MILIRALVLTFLIIALVGAHVLQIGSLIIKPFSKQAFRRANGALAAFWWTLLVEALERVFHVSVEVSGNLPKPPSKNALVISNHQALIDPLIIITLAKRTHSLPALKWFVKRSVIYVPFLGWGLWFLDSIFLKRKWDEDQSKISSSFFRIKSHQDPLWLISFVEGTRQTKLKLHQSQTFASQRGFAPFKNVLFPRYKGFVATVGELGNRIQFIYNLTIQYEHTNPTLTRLLTGDLGKVHLFFEEIDIQTLPKSQDDLRDWLISAFKEKDSLMEKRSQ